MIRQELSFSIDGKFSGETTNQNDDPFKGKFERYVAAGETVEDDDFSFGSHAVNMIEEDSEENNGTEGGFGPSDYGAVDGWDPSDPMFFRNYAMFLQSRGEFFKAEEYYDRAIMADPNNGELLFRYAKLVWELYRDKEQALAYFERAAHAAPGDGDILGAYASFLWEVDEEEGHLSDTQVDDQNGVSWNDMTKDFEEPIRPISPPLHLAMGLGLNMTSTSLVSDVKTESTETTVVEEYYRRMLEKNSCSPLFLKDRTEFLNQSEEDLHGAEGYYSRAMLDNSSNGMILLQYANLMWQLYQDKERADAYFNQAIEVTPRDSNILASYAKFLWEIEDDEEEDSDKSQGDLQVDEQYYFSAMLENPRNGQIMSKYASLVWRLRGDKNRADAYFKRAVQVTPEDSDVLASYAKFLWELDGEEDGDSSEES